MITSTSLKEKDSCLSTFYTVWILNPRWQECLNSPFWQSTSSHTIFCYFLAPVAAALPRFVASKSLSSGYLLTCYKTGTHLVWGGYLDICLWKNACQECAYMVPHKVPFFLRFCRGIQR